MYDEIGIRMKEKYERATDFFLPLKSFQIIRVDGRAFHTYTKHLDKPRDKDFIYIMNNVMKKSYRKIQNCIFAYTQSDEINYILTDLKSFESQTFFDGKIQKIASIAASQITALFAQEIIDYRKDIGDDKFARALPTFDARVFSIPSVEEAGNYLIWRQLDAERNWIAGWAQTLRSQKQLTGLGRQEQIEIIEAEGKDWKTEGWQGYEVTDYVNMQFPFKAVTNVKASKSFRKEGTQSENPIYQILRDRI